MIFFYKNFFKSVVNRKEPEPQFVISAPGGNLISVSRLWYHNTSLPSPANIGNMTTCPIERMKKKDKNASLLHLHGWARGRG